MYGIKNNPVNVVVAWNVTEEGAHLTSTYIKEVSDEDRRVKEVSDEDRRV